MKVLIHPDYAHLSEFIRSIPERFEAEGRVLHNGRNTIKLLEAEGIPLVIKKHKVPNLVNRVAYQYLRKDKARRSYAFGARLRALGIDTPHEIAAIHLSRGGLFTTAYFISEYVEAHSSMREVLACPDIYNRESREHRILLEFTELTAGLHEKGIEHKDFNQTNILVREENGKVRFTIIDTNRIVFHGKALGHKCSERNLCRLSCPPDAFLYFSLRYTERRGWDPMGTIEGIARYRKQFEQKSVVKQRLKRLLGIPPSASAKS